MPAARSSAGTYAAAGRRAGRRRGGSWAPARRQHSREVLRLAVVPHLPIAKRPLERAVAHARAKDDVGRVAQRGVRAREHGDVVADRDGRRLNHEPARAAQRPFGDDVIEQHGVDAPGDEVGVRMDVVVVRHGDDAVARAFVASRCDRPSWRRGCRRGGRGGRRAYGSARYPPGGRRALRGTRSTECVTAWRSRSSGRSSTPDIPTSKSPRSTDASIELHATCTNTGARPSPRAIIPAISTSKPRTREGSAGSASTNGAPPSASPPQRSPLPAAPLAVQRTRPPARE